MWWGVFGGTPQGLWGYHGEIFFTLFTSSRRGKSLDNGAIEEAASGYGGGTFPINQIKDKASMIFHASVDEF